MEYVGKNYVGWLKKNRKLESRISSSSQVLDCQKLNDGASCWSVDNECLQM